MEYNRLIKIIIMIVLFLLFPVFLLSGDTKEDTSLISSDYSTVGSQYTITVHDTRYRINIGSKSAGIYTGQNLLSVYDPALNGKNILSSAAGDINNDDRDELLLLLKPYEETYGDTLVILSCDGDFQEIFNKPIGSLNPWKVQICDVEGDGTAEISIGVYTKSAFHDDWVKRPFIYNYTNNNLQPKWLGSRLSKPFDDYIFCDVDIDSRDELLSIELLQDGKKEIMAYKWKGFGFEGIGNSGTFDDIAEIKSSINEITALVIEHDSWTRKIFKYQDEKLID